MFQFRLPTAGRTAVALAALVLALPALGFLLTADAKLRSADEPKPAARLELKPGDHICIIGNTLADRMQHDGWLETYLHSRFPEHDLVFRNLGFSGDELTMRLRSQSFGTPDQWLAGSAPVPEPNRLVTRKACATTASRRPTPRPTWSSPSSATTNRSPARPASPSSRRTSTTFIKHTLAPEVQRQDGPASGPLLAHRPRGSARPQPARRQGEQRAPGDVHQGDGRGRQGQRRALRGPVPSHARRSTPRPSSR